MWKWSRDRHSLSRWWYWFGWIFSEFIALWLEMYFRFYLFFLIIFYMGVQLSRYGEKKNLKSFIGQLGNQTFQASHWEWLCAEVDLFQRCNTTCWLALCHTHFITVLHFKLCVEQMHCCNDRQVTARKGYKAVVMNYFNHMFMSKQVLTWILVLMFSNKAVPDLCWV